MADRYDLLSPRDLITTISSLPRRFGSPISTATRSEATLALIDAPGPGGESIGRILDDAMRTVSILTAAASDLVRSNDPVISAGALDADSRSGDTSTQSTLASAQSAIANDCESLAKLLQPLLGDGWNRVAKVTGGGTVTLVDLVRELVRGSIDLLNRAEAQARWIQAKAEKQ